MSDAIRTERHDGVVEFVLNTPDRGNVVNEEWVAALDAAVAGVGDQDRCVLLRAEGKNFCFGGDVASFEADDPGERLRDLAGRFHEVLLRFDAIEVPVVVAVHGWAAGAGLSMAVIGDVLVAAEGAKFKSAYNSLGFTGDGGITYNLPRRAPWSVTMDLMLSDRIMTAAELHAVGVVSRVIPDDQFPAAARELAAEIAGKSRFAAVEVKRLLRQSLTTAYAEQLEAETAAIAAAAGGGDGREGIAAFLAKRTPEFNR